MQGPRLDQLLKSSDYISEILDSLKNKLTKTPQTHHDQSDLIEYLNQAIDLKTAFRFLVDGIETNRALVQVQKEQIEKKKVFVEGLQYYKATLKNQIYASQVELTSVKDYLQEEPTPDTDWIEDFPRQQQKILTTLQQFNQRKTLYKQKQSKKQQLIKQLAVQQEKYKKTFPQQVKKLYGQVAETSKIFNLKELDALAPHEFKSRKIQRIHCLLYSLKLKEQINIKHVNQFDIQELEITIEKTNSKAYDFARQNKIMIEEKPLKIHIASVQKEVNQYTAKQEVIAVAVSRRQEFTTEQIFNNLFLQQRVKLIYPNPTSQAQRNTNTKYSQLNWIGQILGSPSSLINGNQFIQKIKNRVFNLNLVKYALQNVTKKVPTYFFPLFDHDLQAYKMSSFPALDSKKISLTRCEKIVFEEYRKEIYIPEWILKAIDNYQILEHVQKLENGKDVKKKIDGEEKQLLNKFIENNNLQELEIKDFYSYYRFQLNAEKNIIAGFILVPVDYPKKRSFIKLISLKKGQNTENIPLNDALSLSIQSQDNQGGIKLFSQDLRQFQIELNEKIDRFIYERKNKNTMPDNQEKKKQSFILFFQINRLLSLLIEKSQHKN